MKRLQIVTAVLAGMLLQGASLSAEDAPQSPAVGVVAASPDGARPLAVGATTPDAIVYTLEGEKVSLDEIEGRAPTAVVFYRGGWCPYCSVQLGELATITGEFRELGFQIVAISPDKPEPLRKMVEERKIDFDLYSDRDGAAMKAFGVAFRLDDETTERYLNRFNLDMNERAGGGEQRILPVPSVFLVDREGVVRFVHSNVDYTKRIKAEEVLAAAKEIVAGKSEE